MADEGRMGRWERSDDDEDDGYDAEPRGGRDGEGDPIGRDAVVPQRLQRTASGKWDRVNREAVAELARRPRAEQSIIPGPRVVRWREFGEGTQFVAYLGRDMKLRVNGDLEVTLVVPYQFKHLAVGLSDVMGVPLSFDVQVWRPFVEAKEARENGSAVV